MTRKTFFVVASFLPAMLSGRLSAQQNNAPVVRITSPRSGSSLPGGSIAYEIAVSDKEDGESALDEITGQEVFLSVRRLNPDEKIDVVKERAKEPDPPGFVMLQKSNCVNCHAFNASRIGPSFQQIATRYDGSRQALDLMVKRVREGVSGIWGSQVMPAHPELTATDTEKILLWILKSMKGDAVRYYSGLSGVFRVNLPTDEKAGTKLLLRASYIDRGIGGNQTLQGTDVVVISIH